MWLIASTLLTMSSLIHPLAGPVYGCICEIQCDCNYEHSWGDDYSESYDIDLLTFKKKMLLLKTTWNRSIFCFKCMCIKFFSFTHIIVHKKNTAFEHLKDPFDVQGVGK